MYKLILTTFLFFFVTTSLYACVACGVGGGLSLASIGIILAIFGALFGLIWFPVKKLFEKRKKDKSTSKNR